MHAGYAEERNTVFPKLATPRDRFGMNRTIETIKRNVNSRKLPVYEAVDDTRDKKSCILDRQSPERDSGGVTFLPDGHYNHQTDIKAFSETDQTEDLKKIDVPTLVLHGDDDQIVPIADSSLLSSKIVKNAKLVVYKGAPHGMCTTHKDKVNEELLAFFKT